jgi:membrane protease YdiL (CAAX protease family)
LDASTWFWTEALSAFMFGGHGALYIAFVLTVPALLIEKREKHGAFGLSLLYVAVFFLCSWLIWQMRPIFDQIPFHSEPATLRDFLAQFGPASFMGLQLKGQWWIPAYYLAVLLAGNIAGEELWWRGYLLPRQEIVHGSSTWIVHGALWAAFHLFFQTTAWDMIRMFPTCCALAFVAQHKKNTWPGMVGHTFGNTGSLLQILHGV